MAWSVTTRQSASSRNSLRPKASHVDFRAALKHGIARLRAAGVPSDTLAAELLLLHATGRNRAWLYAHPESLLSDAESEHYLSLLDGRSSGIPTQHLTGKQEFWGLEFEVTSDVLIPRPETEHVVEVALDRLALHELHSGRPDKNDGASLVIADVGTGSGCIAIGLAKELPAASVCAIDVSSAALVVAKRNADRLGFGHRIRFVESDLLRAAAVSSLRFDLIVSN